MDKKRLVGLCIINGALFLSAVCFAEAKTYKVDLNGDGKEEVIAAEDRFETDAEDIVTVSTEDNKPIGSFSMPDHLVSIELISLNKDGRKQIVARSEGGAHYANMAIYGLQNGKLTKVFESGSACGINADFNAEPPTIKVGVAKLEQKGWSYADEPDWEVWVWDGAQFKLHEKIISSAK